MAERVCPVWVGYLLASPVRKLSQNPEKILSPYIREGMKVLDVGCAMGFFSLPMARMVGSNGKVICIDVQEKMLIALKKRARKAGLSHRIETQTCNHDSLGLYHLKKEIDFALAFAVLHEVPNSSNFYSEIFEILTHTGKFLVAEPRGHVSENDFRTSVSVAEQNGFNVIDTPRISRSRTVLLEKQQQEA